MNPTLIPGPSKEALEQCRSSPAAEFIRKYSGQCRFTPNPDYVSMSFTEEQTIPVHFIQNEQD